MISLFRQTGVEMPYSDLYDEVIHCPRFFKNVKQANARIHNAPYLGGDTL
jgi:hypothetical protein